LTEEEEIEDIPQLEAMEVTGYQLEEPKNKKFYEDIVEHFKLGDEDWIEYDEEYMVVKRKRTLTGDNEELYEHRYMNFYNLYCKRNDQDFLFVMRTSP